jgi:hypothetical protein
VVVRLKDGTNEEIILEERDVTGGELILIEIQIDPIRFCLVGDGQLSYLKTTYSLSWRIPGQYLNYTVGNSFG